ncbi:MAG: PH domain-containing protein [Candidatus Peregrinibacteria bacterium]
MFTFPGQREDEKVLIVIRKHPIVYFRLVLLFVFTIMLPLLLFLWFWFSQYPMGDYPLRGYVVSIFSSLFLLYGLLFFCVDWLNNAFNLFILTDQRLMDITQITLLRRSVISTPLEHIQDASSSVQGILQTLFNYGNVEVQTASAMAANFFIDRVDQPGEIARTIMNAAHDTHLSGQAKEHAEVA